MEPSPQTLPLPTRRRWLRRLGWTTLWLFSLLVLAWVTYNWAGQRAWKAFVQEMEARGESVDIASITPPAVPDEDNFFKAPVFAFLYEPEPTNVAEVKSRSALGTLQVDPQGVPVKFSKTNRGWEYGQPTDLAAWQECFRTNARLVAEDQKQANSIPQIWKEHLRSDYWSAPPRPAAEEVLFGFSVFDSDVEYVREAGERPFSFYPRDYGDLAHFEFKHFATLHKLARVLGLRASAELALGKNEEALDDIFLSLRCADSIKSEPFLIPLLVRMTVASLTIAPIWEGLAFHHWNDAELSRLELEIAAINLPEHYSQTLRGEAILSTNMIEMLRLNPKEIHNWFGNPGKSSVATWCFVEAPTAWFQYSKIASLRTIQSMQPCVDPQKMQILPDRAKRANEELEQSFKFKLHPHKILARMGTAAFFVSMQRCARAQATLNLARIAIALERHFAKHRSYPRSLAELDAAFVPKAGIPHDAASGTPPHYSLQPNGRFSLYYKGWNCTDDGGVADMENGKLISNSLKGDWVWPQPAE